MPPMLKWSELADRQFLERWSQAPDSHDVSNAYIETGPSRAAINNDTENFAQWLAGEVMAGKGVLPGMYVTELGFIIEITLRKNGEYLAVQFIDPAFWSAN